jgi:polo-like kinase 1
MTPKSGLLDTKGLEKNPTAANLGTGTQYLGGTNNPNNQAMFQSTKDFGSTQKVDLKASSKGFGLGSTGMNFNATASNNSIPKSARSEIHVKKWVDYSTKYGLGYILSNGASGVFFNDSTKIILEPKGS